MTIKRDYLFNTEKINYVKKERSGSKCILCAIRDRDPEVTCLEVIRTDTFIISVNLYPFNPGHLMIFPLRHITDIAELSDAEAIDMHHLIIKSTEVIKEEFSPHGFNIGFNIGKESGASIEHLHVHIVPRYPNEVGFIDVLNGSRIVVQDPRNVMNILKNKFST